MQRTHEEMVSGKRISKRTVDSFNWLMITDSHGALMMDKMERQGVNTVVISGGGIDHANEYLKKNDYFRGRMDAIFVILGGNDINRRDVKITELADRFESLVTRIISANKGCKVVTGTAIPRADAADKGDHFINRVELFDKKMGKRGWNHHHFLHDCFVGDLREWKGPIGIREELYVGDKVHLNLGGRDLLGRILAFVLDSVNRDNYKGRAEFPYNRSFRAVLWKF